jgi:hypothetical protein
MKLLIEPQTALRARIWGLPRTIKKAPNISISAAYVASDAEEKPVAASPLPDVCELPDEPLEIVPVAVTDLVWLDVTDVAPDKSTAVTTVRRVRPISALCTK